MNFEEHAAKALLLAPAGIPIPRGILVTDAKGAAEAARQIGPCVVKAQVPVGKRGKAGGIKLANTPAEAEQVASQILGMTIGDYKVERLLIEEQAKIVREFYAAVLFDTAARKPLILFSTEGGMDIEEVADKNPDAIRRSFAGSGGWFGSVYASRLPLPFVSRIRAVQPCERSSLPVSSNIFVFSHPTTGPPPLVHSVWLASSANIR